MGHYTPLFAGQVLMEGSWGRFSVTGQWHLLEGEGRGGRVRPTTSHWPCRREVESPGAPDAGGLPASLRTTEARRRAALNTPNTPKRLPRAGGTGGPAGSLPVCLIPRPPGLSYYIAPRDHNLRDQLNKPDLVPGRSSVGSFCWNRFWTSRPALRASRSSCTHKEGASHQPWTALHNPLYPQQPS